MSSTAKSFGLTLTLVTLMPAMATAASFEFLAAPQTDLNRVYRLNKESGEMGACQYGFVPPPADAAPDKTALDKTSNRPAAVSPPAAGVAAAPEGNIGVTLCYPPGQGGGPQGPSEYQLVASRHAGEGGVFRVDVRTGTMSICYVLNDAVVCTPPAK